MLTCAYPALKAPRAPHGSQQSTNPLSAISTIATMVSLRLPVYPLLHIDRVGPPGAYHIIPSMA